MSRQKPEPPFVPQVGDVVLVMRKYGWMPARVRRVYTEPCIDVGDGDLIAMTGVGRASLEQQIKFLRERLAELERART